MRRTDGCTNARSRVIFSIHHVILAFRIDDNMSVGVPFCVILLSQRGTKSVFLKAPLLYQHELFYIEVDLSLQSLIVI